MSTAQRPLAPTASSFAGWMGMTRIDITPPVGIYARNWGAAAHDVAKSVHRPLTLGALTFSTEPGASPLVLIEADLGFWTTLTRFDQMQSQLLESLQLDRPQLLFAMTHTHAAVHLAEPQAYWPGSELLCQWLDRLAEAAITAARQALDTAEPALLEWHTGRCQLAAHRDLPDPDSDDGRYLCGYNPQQPADDTLLVGRITDTSGRIRATLVNYACHPTTLGWENCALSPDFVGAMREVIAQGTGGEAYFLQGACGELAPRWQYAANSSVADRHGRQLGYATLATLEDMLPPGTRLVFQGVVESGAPLAVWRPEPVAPARGLSAIEACVELELKSLPSADELDSQYRACQDRALAERFRRRRNLRRALGDGRTYHLPVWGWRLGDSLVVGSMAEAYSLFQQVIRSEFADHHIACLNVLNGSIGYLPPAELYDRDLYQVWQTPFAQGSLERYLDAARQLIQQLAAQPVNTAAGEI